MLKTEKITDMNQTKIKWKYMCNVPQNWPNQGTRKDPLVWQSL